MNVLYRLTHTAVYFGKLPNWLFMLSIQPLRYLKEILQKYCIYKKQQQWWKWKDVLAMKALLLRAPASTLFLIPVCWATQNNSLWESSATSSRPVMEKNTSPRIPQTQVQILIVAYKLCDFGWVISLSKSLFLFYEPEITMIPTSED